MTTLRERIVRELECERIQSEIRKNDAEAKKMELEYERIQSEIKKNQAEANHFDRSIIRNFLKYLFTSLISAFLLWAFALDMFKNFYDLTYYDNKSLKVGKKAFQENRQEFNEELLSSLSRFSQQYYLNIEALELLEMEIDAYSALFLMQNKREGSSDELIESLEYYNKTKNNIKEQIKRIKKIESDIRKNIQMESDKIRESLAESD